MKKVLSVVVVILCINAHNAGAEIQLSYKGSYYFRVHYMDCFYMLGIGPMFKSKLKNELYLVSKAQRIESGFDYYDNNDNYYRPNVMCAELELLHNNGSRWAAGPVGGFYVFGKKNVATVENRKLLYFNKIFSVGPGIIVRYSTRADFHFLLRGTVSGSVGSRASFPEEMNAKKTDIDYYDTLGSRAVARYTKEYSDKLLRYENERESYAFPCILSLSVHKYLNYLSCAAGMETVVIPYIPKDDGLYRGVNYKITGYISLGIRILKKRNPSLPFMF